MTIFLEDISEHDKALAQEAVRIYAEMIEALPSEQHWEHFRIHPDWRQRPPTGRELMKNALVHKQSYSNAMQVNVAIDVQAIPVRVKYSLRQYGQLPAFQEAPIPLKIFTRRDDQTSAADAKWTGVLAELDTRPSIVRLGLELELVQLPTAIAYPRSLEVGPDRKKVVEDDDRIDGAPSSPWTTYLLLKVSSPMNEEVKFTALLRSRIAQSDETHGKLWTPSSFEHEPIEYRVGDLVKRDHPSPPAPPPAPGLPLPFLSPNATHPRLDPFLPNSVQYHHHSLPAPPSDFMRLTPMQSVAVPSLELPRIPELPRRPSGTGAPASFSSFECRSNHES
ncbi:uncharacterized protein JCM6883_004452 [Sporobolomyces salmoneus]|uniref:uncharacterized protein n=1 Tax=Sporobolomyces salmoneus TaxID=183962 RepID=UPI0031725ADE